MTLKFIYKPFILLLSFLCLREISLAQDPLMAKGNKTLSISYGVVNFNRIALTNFLDGKAFNHSATSFLNYSIKFSNPVYGSFDYAISDYSTIGVGVNYYSFRLKENKMDMIDTFDLDTKGSQLSIHARGIRYLVQKPKAIFYFFAGIGLRIRSINYNSSDQHDLEAAEIHHFTYANPASYFPLSVDAGMGFKLLITKKIGISSEFGVTTAMAQFGLFYLFKNKWRRSDDNIGW